MLTRDHELRGFGRMSESGGTFTLTFQGRVVDIQLAAEALGPLADGVWADFLMQRRSQDREGE